MNKYQISIIWIVIVIVTITLLPIFYFVLKLDTSKSLLIYFSIMLFLLSVVLFISLRGSDESKVKEKFTLIKKYLIIISCFFLLIPLYHLSVYIIKEIEQKNFEEKEKLLLSHISNKHWLKSNILLLEGSLTYSPLPDTSFKFIESLNGIIQNNSPIDLHSVKVLVKIYEGSSQISQDSIIIDEFVTDLVKGLGKQRIKEYILYSAINKVPSNFSWSYEIVGAEPSTSYIKNISHNELTAYLNSDSLNKYEPKEKFNRDDYDWDAIMKDLNREDSLRKNK